MSDCLFCKIIDGDIPSDKIYENDDVYAFRDINPVAPLHTLIIPKKHIAMINDLKPALVEQVSGTRNRVIRGRGGFEILQ
jgi:histidine triad (HIT) family protein